MPPRSAPQIAVSVAHHPVLLHPLGRQPPTPTPSFHNSTLFTDTDTQTEQMCPMPSTLIVASEYLNVSVSLKGKEIKPLFLLRIWVLYFFILVCCISCLSLNLCLKNAGYFAEFLVGIYKGLSHCLHLAQITNKCYQAMSTRGLQSLCRIFIL